MTAKSTVMPVIAKSCQLVLITPSRAHAVQPEDIDLRAYQSTRSGGAGYISCK